MIENRDEYLQHSSKNYTAEQKNYNNRLTEELLEVAEQYHYVFDPEDFNFVAIRDRIRCYYKSYVQTARKRGLQLSVSSQSPVGTPVNPTNKRPKLEMEAKDTAKAETQADEKDANNKEAVENEKTAHEKNVKAEEIVEKKDEEIAVKKADEKETEEKEAVHKDTDEKEAVDKDASEVLDTAAGKETEKAAAGNKIIIIFTAHTIG